MTMKTFRTFALGGALLVSVASCSGAPLSTREKGTLIGGGTGAVGGALIGGAVGHPGAVRRSADWAERRQAMPLVITSKTNSTDATKMNELTW
jgi:hypothetical protein